MSAAVTEERLIGAIELVSEVILLHGAKFAPILDRLERDLAELRRYEDPVSRARQHLARARSGAAVRSASPAPAQPG